MIKLINLSFQNIGRFVEKQTIDFSTKQKLLQFDGKNENTGGSSGSGKSTVFHALDYLLGLNDTPATSLQSRLTKDSIWVSGEFLADGNLVTITRSKKDGLTIATPTEVIEGNVKIAEEVLDRLIKIPRKIFSNMIHKRQGEGGWFLNLTTKESYDFLSEALGLQECEDKSNKIDLDIDSKNKLLISLISDIDNTNRNLESLKSTLNSVEKPEEVDLNSLKAQIQLESGVLEICTLKISDLKALSEKIESSLKEEMSKELTPQPKIEVSVEAERLQYELSEILKNELIEKHLLENEKNHTKEKIKITSDSISDIKYKEQRIKSTVPEIIALKEQKTHLEDSKCPTCSQEWKGDELVNKLKQIEDLCCVRR